MGKVALFAISAFVVMGSFYGVSTQTDLLATDQRIAEYQYTTTARNVALAGYNRAKQHLADNFTSTFVSGSFETGYYSAEVEANTTTKIATVNVIGRVFDATGAAVKYYIFAEFEQQPVGGGIATEPPDFMQYALITEEDLTLNGNVSIDTVKASGWEGAPYNANIHTNGQMTVNGKVSIRGFGSYRTSKILNPNEPTRFFKPYYNPTGEPVLKQVSGGIELPLADFTPAALNAKIAPDSSTGSVTLNGNHDFTLSGSTRENPFVWYIDGDLTMNGDVNLTGYVIFLVRNSVILNGNVTVTMGDGPSENKMALYACNDITLNGTVDVLWGQIFAKDDFIMSGTPIINGNVVVGSQATLNGTPDINYFPPSPALTRYWQESNESVLKMLAYSERDDEYDG